MTPQYLYATPLKFLLMSICTLGIYEIYWNYKNWRYIKERDESSAWPFWRAIFYPLWFYALLSDISRQLPQERGFGTAHKWFLLISLLLLSASYRLPDPWWLLSVLTIIPMMPAAGRICELNAEAVARGELRNHTPVNYFAYALGGPLMALTIFISLGVMPGNVVVEGSAMRDSDLQYLRENEILAEGEEVLYFYSAALWSIEDDGQFISEDYVTSYYRDTESDTLYLNFAAYGEIADITLQWSQSSLEDTIVTIHPYDSEPFEVWISAEEGGDNRFVAELRKRWRAAQKQARSVPVETPTDDLAEPAPD